MTAGRADRSFVRLSLRVSVAAAMMGAGAATGPRSGIETQWGHGTFATVAAGR